MAALLLKTNGCLISCASDGRSLFDSPNRSPLVLYPDLINAIQRTCHRVHFILGPGFLHQVYRRATRIELRCHGLSYDYLKQLPVEYEGHLLGYQAVRLIVVEGKVRLTTFALRNAEDAMVEQIKAYLRRLHLKLGVMANFYGTKPALKLVRVP